MAAIQHATPDGGYINETTNIEHAIPLGGYVRETATVTPATAPRESLPLLFN